MSEIHVKEGESIDSALKRFKRSCAKAGVIAEVRKREHYESPSVKRRKKSEAARKNKKRFYLEAKVPHREVRYFFFICGGTASRRCRRPPATGKTRRPRPTAAQDAAFAAACRRHQRE